MTLDLETKEFAPQGPTLTRMWFWPPRIGLVIALYGKPISELRSVIYRMGSQCYLPLDIGKRAPPSPAR